MPPPRSKKTGNRYRLRRLSGTPCADVQLAIPDNYVKVYLELAGRTQHILVHTCTAHVYRPPCRHCLALGSAPSFRLGRPAGGDAVHTSSALTCATTRKCHSPCATPCSELVLGGLIGYPHEHQRQREPHQGGSGQDRSDWGEENDGSLGVLNGVLQSPVSRRKRDPAFSLAPDIGHDRPHLSFLLG